MPDPAPVSVDTPNVLDLQFIVVTVRTDFRFKKADGTIVFHWGGEAIAEATVELLGAGGSGGTAVHDSAVTDRQGQAALETSQLTDGDYTVRITPKNSRNQLAGPNIAEDDPLPLPTRMYHPLDVAVKLAQGSINAASIDSKVRYAGLGNRVEKKWPPDSFPTDHLPIDLKPIWMRAPRASSAEARTTDQIQMVVVHNTGADSTPEAFIGGDIETFIGGGSEAHYLMDFNGHVIKFMKDHVKAWHAGGKWKGNDPNDISIGLEIVHKEAGVHEYTDDQYTSLIEFLGAMGAAYPIDRTQIVGHSDVGTHILAVAKVAANVDLDLLDGDRDQDPGQVFRWEKLEQRGWGMVPQNVELGNSYGGLFNLADDVVLRTGDNDDDHRFGGKKRTDIDGTPIKDLKQDLSDIGYSLKRVSGKYDRYTELAVAAFQRHFFSGDRRRKADGKIDRETAQMIKKVKGS